MKGEFQLIPSELQEELQEELKLFILALSIRSPVAHLALPDCSGALLMFNMPYDDCLFTTFHGMP